MALNDPWHQPWKFVGNKPKKWNYKVVTFFTRILSSQDPDDSSMKDKDLNKQVCKNFLKEINMNQQKLDTFHPNVIDSDRYNKNHTPQDETLKGLY